MSEFNTSFYEDAGDSLRAYMNKVFTTMAIGMVLTAAIAFWGYWSVATGGILYSLLVSNSIFPFVLMIAEFGIVIALSRGLTRYEPVTCRALFFGYCASTGLTFSILPMVYGISDVFIAFVFAAVLFICMAIIGHTTKVDLSRFSGLMMGGLLALVIMSVISLFVPVLRNSLMIGYLGLVLFLALTAWDIQKIKSFYYSSYGGNVRENMAIYGAFQLYLDFVNIFLYVLRIVASRNRRD